jgi:uncharacterized protein (TIGR03083 family)
VTDTWQLVDDERRDLLSFVDSLSFDDWEHDTLCEGWRVRHVIAHINWVPNITVASILGPLLAARGNLDRAINNVALRDGKQDVRSLRNDLEAIIGNRSLPPKTTTAGMLVDTLVHHQDIRRALGRMRTIAEDRLRVALDEVVRAEKTRCRGITIRATDLLFEQGSGPVLEGSGEALLMTLSGRGSALTELTGMGFEVMAGRLG